jgi:hypothetical protein
LKINAGKNGTTYRGSLVPVRIDGHDGVCPLFILGGEDKGDVRIILRSVPAVATKAFQGLCCGSERLLHLFGYKATTVFPDLNMYSLNIINMCFDINPFQMAEYAAYQNNM